jgi:ABC-type antimicrobial peptide transport system permease subunit
MGLAIGMAAVILLMLNVTYEYSVDQFHEKKATIYKVYNNSNVNGKIQSWEVSSASLAPALKQDIPSIKNITRVSGSFKTLAYGDKKLGAAGKFTDPAFLQLFSFPLKEGSPLTAMQDIYSIVITEEFAHRLFGNEDPISKTIRANNTDDFKVTAVLKDLPQNTDFKFDFLLPWEFLRAKGIENAEWSNLYVQTFVEMEPAANIDAVNRQVKDIVDRYSHEDMKLAVFLYPFEKVHLYGKFDNGKPTGGNISNIRFFLILGFIILLIACINFMNLSTARSVKRAREVGVRKVIGARRGSLILQFIGESILLSAFSAIIALGIVHFVLPAFSSVGQVKLSVPWTSPQLWLSIIGFVIFTGILAGSYPAFYLSSFRPVKVLKGMTKTGNALLAPRKILVVVQFVLSIVFINFTIVFQKQINHTLNREIGYEKENLLFHPMTLDLLKNYTALKNELINSGAAVSVSKSSATVNGIGTRVGGLEWEGMAPGATNDFDIINSRKDFIKTNGLQLIAGRDIDTENYPTDTLAMVLNESAATVMGFKEPVGQIITDDSVKWRVVGVVKDFIVSSPNGQVHPLLIRGDEGNSFINIRLTSSGAALATVAKVETIIKKYNPGFLTDYQFADVQYANKFKQTKRVAALVKVFALMAIFISCMGLFGLAAYMAETRTREIGIRKVLGATVPGVAVLLAKDFIKLVTIAIIIASPIAWLLLGKYLQQFSYRTTVDWWIMLIAGGLSLIIAILTVSVQSIKTAMANPVRSIRIE